MNKLSAYEPESWPEGTDLELTVKCGFPIVQAHAADPMLIYNPSMITTEALILHAPERVRLVRHLDNGKHILCKHANKTLFIASSKRFIPIAP